jgi:hypothetical protein
VFVEHFDDIQVESAVDAETREGDAGSDNTGVFDRIQSWLR